MENINNNSNKRKYITTEENAKLKENVMRKKKLVDKKKFYKL